MRYVAITIAAFGFVQTPSSATVDPCLVPQRARAALTSAQQPGGIEFLPEALTCQRLVSGGRELAVSIADKPLLETFDTLARLDPRYEWRKEADVVTLRPVAAWRDERHFLQRAVEMLALHNENLGIALNQ